MKKLERFKTRQGPSRTSSGRGEYIFDREIELLLFVPTDPNLAIAEWHPYRYFDEFRKNQENAGHIIER